jgi:hypothetical protein
MNLSISYCLRVKKFTGRIKDWWGVGGGGRAPFPPPYPYKYLHRCTASNTHAHKTHNIQHRIQNIKTHVHKITNLPVFLYGAWTWLILMGTNPLLGPLEGKGAQNGFVPIQINMSRRQINNRYIHS